MQSIEIKNFGPVKNARIEIRRLTVLIGEQASGKSTIAKLIYFFKTISDEFFARFYQSEQVEWRFDKDIIFPIQQRFYDYFGSTHHMGDFEIVYYYSETKWLKLSLDQDKKLVPWFSDNFFRPKNKTLKIIKESLLKVNSELEKTSNVQSRLTLERDRMSFVQRLTTVINELFCSTINDSLFIIAGRNATVGYSDFFEKQLYSDLQTNIKAYSKKIQTIDETLMLKFIERVSRIKSIFVKYKDFNGIIEQADPSVQSSLEQALDLISGVLRGKYETSTYGERLILPDEQYIYMRNASSGQQEAIRILQDVFVAIFEGNNVFRIIEETEAHLFPMAQKNVIELLALLLNTNPNNELLLTTHSPYVLSVINNLLFAERVIDNNKEARIDVDKIVPPYCRLQTKDFAAYAIGNSFMEREIYCESIVSSETGMIDQSYLDIISEMLGQDFNQLYRIHAKSFTNK